MRYPKLRKELLKMLEDDQCEVREYSKAFKSAPKDGSTHAMRDRFIVHSRGRVKRVLEILDEIGEPTVESVGADGSQAISILVLHSHLSSMKKILSLFEKSYGEDPRSVHYEAIPSLMDRILVIDRRKQKFGTQWILGEDGRFFLPPVEDFERMNERRAAYGLGRSQLPIDMTYGMPEHEPSRPETRATDQRLPTDREYQDFTYGSLD